MRAKPLQFLVAALALCVSGAPAIAQTPAPPSRPIQILIHCYQWTALVSWLGSTYGESPRASGHIPGQPQQTVIFANDETGSFTIVQRIAHNATFSEGCIMAGGEGWQEIPQQLPGEDG